MQFTLLIVLSFSTLAQAAPDAKVPKWTRWEGSFQAVDLKGSIPERIEFGINLVDPSGNKFTWPGFWDGEKTFKVRLRPDQEGKWFYKTYSKPNLPGLDGIQGTLNCTTAPKDSLWTKHGMVRVVPGKSYLEHQDGTPFFWLGDTVWNGPLLSSRDDWNTYLRDRDRKGFSVVQFNALAPWRAGEKDSLGNRAFSEKPASVNLSFFRNLDEKMDAIEKAGLLSAPVMIWSLTKKDPGSFLPDEDIIHLCKYQLARYGSHPLVWILAGDNPYQGPQAEKWKRIGREVFGSVPHAPVTTHPTGRNWPWDTWKNEKWLDILGYQSGHGDDNASLKWTHSGPVQASLGKGFTKPIINLEPPYEDHVAYQSKKPIPASLVRKSIYWSLFTVPIAGVTYGGHGMWSWQTTPGVPLDHPGSGIAQPWKDAKDLPGSGNMLLLTNLIHRKQIPWWNLAPAPLLLFQQPGMTDPSKFIACCATRDLAVVMAYLPQGGMISLRNLPPSGEMESEEWWSPQTGGTVKAKREGQSYQAPDQADWVLILKRKAAK